MIRIINFFIILGIVGCSFANGEKICTKNEAIQAETEANKLNNWDSLYNSFKRYAHCDDAAISEGYSDSIGRLLAFEWKQFKKLHELVKSDKIFEQFILKHIDETIPADELKIILDNARTHCPPGAEELCKSIEKAAQ